MINSLVKKCAVIASSFLIFGLFAAAEANAQVQEVLKRMDEHQKALTSLKANVIMDKFNSQLDEHDISKEQLCIYGSKNVMQW